MPAYHIISRELKVSKTVFKSEGIIEAKSIRSAFGRFKKMRGKKIDPKRQYLLHAINHSRMWDSKQGKWNINSFYGNHKKK